MNLTLSTAEIYSPVGLNEDHALEVTTHMAIGAHQDDLEIMACQAVVECFQQDDKWFTGIVVTNGAGSPRAGLYRDYSDEAMQAVRRKEQKKAALTGEYAALALLDFPSSAVKDGVAPGPVNDLAAILSAAQPDVLYTHNLADKHDTRVAVTLRVLAAARSLPPERRPRRVLGCEVWRNLDWLLDDDKITLDASAHMNLQAALLGIFDSQIAGGKRYDLAAMGRRRANATFFQSHDTDETEALTFAMDLTPLIDEPERDPGQYVADYIARMNQDVLDRIGRFQ